MNRVDRCLADAVALLILPPAYGLYLLDRMAFGAESDTLRLNLGLKLMAGPEWRLPPAIFFLNFLPVQRKGVDRLRHCLFAPRPFGRPRGVSWRVPDPGESRLQDTVFIGSRVAVMNGDR
jgi:hypothetical protein